MNMILPFLFFAAFAAALPAPRRAWENMSQPFSQTELTLWNAGAVTEFPIHSSCNATQCRQIDIGLNEAISLAGHAKSHILRWGNESHIYRKYFGNSPSMNTIGAFDIVVSGDKKDISFRCDNPDGKCNIEGMKPPYSKDMHTPIRSSVDQMCRTLHWRG